MSSLDLRGFDYRLEPLLKRQRWRVEAQQLKLARLHDTIARCREEQESLEQARRHLCEQALQNAPGAGDLAAYRRTLAHLAGLWQRKADGERMLELLDAQKKALLGSFQTLQRRLELLEKHKEHALTGYSAELQQKHDSDMDREWLARRLWRAAQGASAPEMEEKRV